MCVRPPLCPWLSFTTSTQDSLRSRASSTLLRYSFCCSIKLEQGRIVHRSGLNNENNEFKMKIQKIENQRFYI